MTNPFVFLVGCARSATTLLQRLAHAHPDLAVTHETRWIAPWHERGVGVDAAGRVTDELVERLAVYDRLKAFRIEPSELFALYRSLRPVTYVAFVTALFDRFAARHGKPVAGDKTPDYALSMPLLHDLWPGARFVHIIRDGRDVAGSMLEWQKGAARFPSWHVDPIVTTACWWDWHVRLAREAGSRLGPDLYHELRYEALVADPGAECARLCAFLG